MSKIRIVVDSAADFPSATFPKRYKLTLAPQKIQFGDEIYLEPEQMDAEGFFQRLSHNAPHPLIHAPTVEQYIAIYNQLCYTTDQIISLHTTRTLSDSWKNARTAADSLIGRCNIAVLDSKTTSAGLGLLAEIAAQAADSTDNIDDAVRLVRAAVDRVYSIFYVDTLDFIQKKGLLGEAQAVLGTMLGIKPFLTIEDGNLLTMEKVRTRSQAVDKLLEFVTEFDSIEKVVILQNSPFITEAVRLLQDRLAGELGKRTYPTILYGPLLASYLGTDATGVVVIEKSF